MNTTDQLAQYSADLTSTYRNAVAVMDTQPKVVRGALIVLETLGENLNGLAYGTPEQWADMLLSVATRNQDFCLAFILAYRELESIAVNEQRNSDQE